MTLKPFILDLVARLSSRLFVGEDLCRNEEWLELAKNYTLDSFAAGRVLRSWPFALRRIAVWFLPEWKKVRQDVVDAKRILAAVIKKRLDMNRAADAKGVPRPKTKDTIQVRQTRETPWPRDAADAQCLHGSGSTMLLNGTGSSPGLWTRNLLSAWWPSTRRPSCSRVPSSTWRRTTLSQLARGDDPCAGGSERSRER